MGSVRRVQRVNNEILRKNELFGKNENLYIFLAKKHTKIGKEKFTNNSQIKTEFTEHNLNNNNNIVAKWLMNKSNNCRYNSFITLFYFTISPFR